MYIFVTLRAQKKKEEGNSYLSSAVPQICKSENRYACNKYPR